MKPKVKRGLVNKPSKAVICSKCQRVVLDGIDFGRPYRVDPLPVVVNAEIGARTQGRYSWSVMDDGSVRLRDLYRVKQDGDRRPVLLSHDCSPLDATAADARFIHIVREVAASAVPADADHDALLVLRNVLGATVYEDDPPF